MTPARYELMELASGCDVIGVAPCNLHLVWEPVKRLLELVVAHNDGEFDAEDLLNLAEQGFMQVWIAGKNQKVVAVMVTEIVIYPRQKALKMVAMAGTDFSEWEEGWNKIEAWAREHGCTRVEAMTRPGITKLAKRHGFREMYRFIRKDIAPVTLQ